MNCNVTGAARQGPIEGQSHDSEDRLALGDASQRMDISLSANWEIEVLADAALAILAAEREPGHSKLLLLRGLLSRIRGLNSITMAALGDDAEDLDALAYKLRGAPNIAEVH